MGDETPMTAETRTGSSDARIDLATTPDFDVGALRVRPSRRQTVLPGEEVRDLEPRVMKVLVALAESRSEVVSRDQLIERCWDGRIVGDDAINRCIVALRNFARSAEPPPFTIETFPRIGYSLTEHGASAAPATAADAASPSLKPGRRAVLAGLGAAGILAAGGGIYWAMRPRGLSSTNEVALEWYRRGVETREQGLPELFPQVQAHFREAVAADPEFAEAWSALALSYASPVFLEGGIEQAALAQRAQAAAEHALRLDPNSLEARTALAFIPSEFGRWGDGQAKLRALLAEGPEGEYLRWVLMGRITYSLMETGRCADALAMARQIVQLKPMHPNSRNFLVTTLWMTGDLEEAERESAEASARWPLHPGVWVTRLAMLTFSGRASQAMALATAPDRPPAVRLYDGVVDRRFAVAKAMSTGARADIDHAASLYLQVIREEEYDMIPAARFFAAVGQLDLTFDVTEGYYFNTGRFALPNRFAFNPLTRFEVSSLFWPPFAPARRDPRFDRLTDRIGLGRYWQELNIVPDYRQAARS